MEYEFKFCVGCYLHNATGLAAALLEEHDHDEGFALRLVPGASGQFDVKRDGKLLYSSKDTGRLPVPGEIQANLRSPSEIEIHVAPGKACC